MEQIRFYFQTKKSTVKYTILLSQHRLPTDIILFLSLPAQTLKLSMLNRIFETSLYFLTMFFVEIILLLFLLTIFSCECFLFVLLVENLTLFIFLGQMHFYWSKEPLPLPACLFSGGFRQFDTG